MGIKIQFGEKFKNGGEESWNALRIKWNLCFLSFLKGMKVSSNGNRWENRENKYWNTKKKYKKHIVNLK